MVAVGELDGMACRAGAPEHDGAGTGCGTREGGRGDVRGSDDGVFLREPGERRDTDRELETVVPHQHVHVLIVLCVCEPFQGVKKQRKTRVK